MRYSNLIEILSKRKHLDGIGITFIEGSKQEYFLSYQELYHSALKGLSFLQNEGIQPKDELVFQIDDNKSFIIVFWACILGGIIPVPLSCGHNEDSKQKLFNIWPILNNPYLIISQKNVTRLSSFAKQKGLEDAFSEMGNNIIDEAGITTSPQEGNVFDVKENDIAFIQFSSGSTGNPKGIVLTHKNLISNLEAISEASMYSADDSMISWMPLTHDMGLIGFHMNPLACGMNQYLIPTNLFIRRPLLWLDKASEHKVSILCSPNFGYRYFSKHFCISDTYNWELSHVRIIYNGAEPISQKLCWDFLNSLAKYGLKSRSMCPVYGLAEASLAVSISGLHDEVISIDLDRNKLNVGDKVLKVCGNDSVSFVNVGKSVNYCSIRITDNDNFALENETLGHVQIKGDNVTSGYYNNDDHTKNTVLKDGWLKTGDLGFISDGSLYIIGRAKDIIFINGQNYYPHDIERIAEEVDGIELNKIIVVGYFNHQTEKEEVIAFVFHRANIEKFIPIAKSLRTLVNIKMGFEVDRIIPVKDIPRTTSGKLQRFKLLEQYKNGDFREIELELKRVIDESGTDTIFATGPENEAEQKVLEICRRILKCNTISVTDNFFENGGNSLKAAEMEMMVLKEFQVELPLEMLYEKQTVRELAEVIKSLRKQKYVPIPVVYESIYYPVSSSQKRLYYLWELDKTSIAYNIPVAFRIVGEINFKRLEDSIKGLISRHDSLRMSFHMTSEPKFKVHDHVAFALNCIACSASELNDKLQNLVKSFDLGKEPLFRIYLLKLNNNEHTLFLDFHHIISDGISLYNFVEELFNIYSAKELQELPVKFKDYPNWERKFLQSEKIEGQESYWLKELEGELPTLEMPLDFPRPVIFNTEGQKIEFGLNKEITEQLKDIAKANKCTQHALMFTLFNILLSKYTGQEDIIVGIPVAGRRHPDLQYVHGMFVNNLAIRSIIKGEESFTQFLTTENNRIKEALNNQDFPFEELVQRVGGKRNVSRNPVFDSMFIYQSTGFPKIENGELILCQHFFDPGFSKFDISMEIFDDDDLIKYNIEYSTRLFKKETITRLAAHFNNLIKRVIDNPNSKLSDLHILHDSEYNEYIKKFNNTEHTYPKNTTIHQLFEEQVKRSPANIAVEYGDKSFTYQQLNNKATHLAKVLREKGIVPNSTVGILIPRSPELIISILGVLKAGGSYLGIDTDLPGERINLLISNSECRLVIAGPQSVSNLKLNDSKAEIINIDDLDLLDFESANVKNVNSANDLAYLIYSSGTTGDPKGIMIEHRSLVNYISWAADNYINGEKTTFPLYTSISFDLTVTSIFTPLITGNKIVIYNEEGNDLVIEKILADNKVDIVKLTPSHFRVLRASKLLKSTYQSKIKKFIVGGEQLESRLANDVYKIFHSNVEIFNEYGPTEATVGCMIYKYDPEDPQYSVPIGIPISNTQIYILDKFLNPTTIGVSGEIYISGEGLARGYLNSVEMTNQKFIPNPFIEDKQMYATGDFAKRLYNGTIEYIGRSDQQVKINGYRIELSEIESHLVSHRNIEAALVVVNKKNQKNLLAYFKSHDFIEEGVLKSYLVNRLPHYMIPVHFIRLEVIPLTKNGKVDYNALPEPEVHVETKVNLLPKSEIEQLCLKIWEDVLGENNLSTTDNFFKLGGDSIKAVQIASSLLDKGISLTAKDILTYQTINQTSLRAEILGSDIKYEQGIVEGDIRLTPIECWFFSQNFENPNYYNQSILLKLNKKVNIPLLEETFRKVVEHHNSLRVNYNPEKKVLYYNSKHLDKKFVVEQFETGVTNDSFSELSEICQLVQGSFDITNSLLLKAAIIKEIISSEMLFITAHHLIIDGVSWRVLLEDLHTIYNALEKVEAIKLPRKTATLIDWERKLYEYSRSEGLKIQGDYWNEIERFVFAIPQDFETNDWKVRNLNKLSGTLNKEKSNFLIKDAHQTYKTDVPILLNTALALTLKEWTTSDIFVIEQENHGRHLDDIDTSRTLGWFTAMYPLKLKLKDDSIGNQIKAIKEQIKKVPDYGIGYGIFKYYEKRHGRISNDLSEIRLNYLGQFDKELNNEFFTYSTRSTGSDVDPNNLMTTKLELNSMIINGELRLEIKYNKEAHKESTIKWFRDVFFNNLEKILRHIENEDDIHFTPSDFGSVSLNQEELDALF